MLASMFVMGGYSALRNPQQHVRMAGPVTEQLSEASAQAPTATADEKQLVMINGAAQLIGGLALATGRFPRLASLVLAGSLVPTTYAGHRFWEETDKTKRANQQIHFVKNVSMLGGLLIAAVDTEGKPGVAWRATHAVGAASHQAKGLGKGVAVQAVAARKAAAATTKASAKATKKASKRAGRKAGKKAGKS
jgi:uncharacterized membrane protein YphA (DoxX/SURF4 family)